jgi:hypothetical protein
MIKKLNMISSFQVCSSAPAAKFLVPDWGIQSTYGLWHRVVVSSRQATQAGRPVRQSYAIIDFISQSRTKNLASGHLLYFSFISYLFFSGAPVRQPYAIIDYISKSGTQNLASGHLLYFTFISYLFSLYPYLYISPRPGYVYSRYKLICTRYKYPATDLGSCKSKITYRPTPLSFLLFLQWWNKYAQLLYII